MKKECLRNKVAVITGAGSGIGQACAVRLSAEGVNIVLLGGRNEKKLRHTESLVNEHSSCRVIPGDLTDLGALAGLASQAAEVFGQTDILINNAGRALSTPFEEVTEEEYFSVMDINMHVPFFLTKHLIPELKKSAAASIINIASVSSHLGYPLQSVYTASKHALLGFTKCLAGEYYKEGIRVHAICPGGVYTDMVKVSRPDLSSEGLILPDEIAETVLFLLENRGNAVVDAINVHRITKAPFLV